MMDAIIAVLSKNALVTALAVTGLMMFVSHLLSKYLTKGKLQSSAIAITLGLVVAYFAGVYTQGTKGVSDIAIFSGFALLGGAMIRDLAIASTAFEVDVKEVKKAGKIGLEHGLSRSNFDDNDWCRRNDLYCRSNYWYCNWREF